MTTFTSSPAAKMPGLPMLPEGTYDGDVVSSSPEEGPVSQGDRR